MSRSIVFGYIDQFAGLSLNTPTIIPRESRMHSGQAARIITLANGAAHNMGWTGTRFPVEERLKLCIRHADGAKVDQYLGSIDAKHGIEGTLTVYVPDMGGANYSCTAVLDEIIEEDGGNKAEGTVNNGNYTLVFQRMTPWS